MLEQKCVCGIMQNFIDDPNCPVTFDEQMNEYHVVSEGRQWIMNYCWWCGGKLSESRRDNFFKQPDDGEVQEMRRLLVKTRTFDDVIAVLGPPDCRHTARGQVPETLQYSTRWKTLELHVQQIDGRLSKSWFGKRMNAPSQAKPPCPPWWQFWKSFAIRSRQ